jgi:hypothetical protein
MKKASDEGYAMIPAFLPRSLVSRWVDARAVRKRSYAVLRGNGDGPTDFRMAMCNEDEKISPVHHL